MLKSVTNSHFTFSEKICEEKDESLSNEIKSEKNLEMEMTTTSLSNAKKPNLEGE